MDPILLGMIKKASSPSDSQVASAVNSYLTKNPVQAYDDTEIKENVNALKSDLSKISDINIYENYGYNKKRTSINISTSNINNGIPLSNGAFNVPNGNVFFYCELNATTLTSFDTTKARLYYIEYTGSYKRYIIDGAKFEVKNNKIIVNANYNFTSVNTNNCEFRIYMTSHESDLAIIGNVEKLFVLQTSDNLSEICGSSITEENIATYELNYGKITDAIEKNKITREMFTDEMYNKLLNKESNEISLNEPLFNLFKPYGNRKIKIDIIGDSTSDGDAGPSAGLYNQLKIHQKSGGLLDGATIIDRGSNGSTSTWFIENLLQTCVDDNADLYVISYGINDVRLGQSSIESLTTNLKTIVNRLLENEKAHILLRVPNSLGTDDTSEQYIQPYTSAQEYTDILWNTYQGLSGVWSCDRVAIIDMQTLIFGRTCKPSATNDLMMDVLHPSTDLGQKYIADVIAESVGSVEKMDKRISDIVETTNSKPWEVYPLCLDDTTKYKLILVKGNLGITNTYYGFRDITKSEFLDVYQSGDIVRFGNIFATEINPTSYNEDAANRKLVINQNLPLTTNEINDIYDRVDYFKVYRRFS